MRALAVSLVAVMVGGCATGREGTVPASAKDACAPPPAQLVVKDLAPGKGDDAVRFRTAVLVGYTGWLYDGCAKDFKGRQFDSSEGRATPFGFMVGAQRVIKGWDEGLVGMREGGKRLLVIPPDKAYGDRAVGDVIKPNSTLVFEIDLLRIVGQAEPAPKPQ